jgi:hypothetical protein
MNNFANLYESFGNEAFVCLSSTVWYEQKGTLSYWSRLLSMEESTFFAKKSCRKGSMWRGFKREFYLYIYLSIHYLINLYVN